MYYTGDIHTYVRTIQETHIRTVCTIQETHIRMYVLYRRHIYVRTYVCTYYTGDTHTYSMYYTGDTHTYVQYVLYRRHTYIQYVLNHILPTALASLHPSNTTESLASLHSSAHIMYVCTWFYC